MAADVTETSALVEEGLHEGRARVAAVQAADEAALELGALRLLRLGSNAVFVGSGVLVRVAPAASSRVTVERSVGVARWLIVACARPRGDTVRVVPAHAQLALGVLTLAG